MIEIVQLSNGLSVIVDPMPEVESVAFDVVVPGGIVLDDAKHVGASHLLAELSSRGAGSYDSRQLSDQFENAGISHGEYAGADRFVYRASFLSEHIERAFELLSLVVTKPTLPEDEVESIQSVLLQDIASLSDSPSRWAMVELNKRFFPEPFNRPSMGTADGISSTQREFLLKDWKQKICPKGSLLSIAGRVDTARIIDLAKKHFGEWQGEALKVPRCGALPEFNRAHIQHESAQLQIALAYPSAAYGDRDFYIAKVASVILSGGMFGRLFVEVREKRGLCYSVYCRHSATKDYGFVTAYAGTTPERAHETLEVMVRELKGLKGTVTDVELERAKANVKASIILGEESSGSRASSNGSDYWIDKKVRTMEEIMAQVNKVTAADIDTYLERFPVDAFRLVTLGSVEIA